MTGSLVIKTLAKWFINLKVYISRAGSYISMLNTGMILLLFLSQLKAYGFNINLTKWAIPLYCLTIILLIILGYLDNKLGIHKYEVSITQKQNTDIQEILKEIKEIKEKLK